MKKRLIVWMLLAALTLSLCACAKAPAAESAEAQAAPAETAEAAAEPAAAGRQDGERFEETIQLEGMEETVRYEHVRNEALGFELDYEFEDLERRSEAECERFISRWDDPADPWNYLEVRSDTGSAERVASALAATLAGAYDTVETQEYTLARAGECLQIFASGAREGSVPGSLQTVYVIPAGNGCLVAAAHYTYESAEGFGRRFEYMLDTLTALEGRG